jgi:hypothetical protein
MKTESEIKRDMEALSDMLSDIKARVKAYNMLSASSDLETRVGLLEGTAGSYINDCETFFPETNFWFPSSWGC